MRDRATACTAIAPDPGGKISSSMRQNRAKAQGRRKPITLQAERGNRYWGSDNTALEGTPHSKDGGVRYCYRQRSMKRARVLRILHKKDHAIGIATAIILHNTANSRFRRTWRAGGARKLLLHSHSHCACSCGQQHQCQKAAHGKQDAANWPQPKPYYDLRTRSTCSYNYNHLRYQTQPDYRNGGRPASVYFFSLLPALQDSFSLLCDPRQLLLTLLYKAGLMLSMLLALQCTAVSTFPMFPALTGEKLTDWKQQQEAINLQAAELILHTNISLTIAHALLPGHTSHYALTPR
eukprot:1161466-Pelagomonas_calceolata.AAC.4